MKIHFDKHSGKHVLSIPELRHLRRQDFNYRRQKTYYQKKKLFAKLTAFFDWYLGYCDSILKGKHFSEEIIAQVVLKDYFKNEEHWKEYLTKSLFLSKQYVAHLKEKVTLKRLNAFEHTLSSLETDLEWLIIQTEIYIKKSIDELANNSYRSHKLTPTDLYSAARTLFRIEEFNKMEDLYLRDLKPVVMFQIRQLLEVYGKDLIGYRAIVDKNGYPIKKFTQIAWEYIKYDSKSTSPRIQLPFDVQMIININKWANNFVHTTYLYNSYIQHFVLNAIGVLFKIAANDVTIFNGKTSTRLDIAHIEIREYDALKSDFEKYLNDKRSDTHVDWKDINKVGAYIISE